MEELGFRYFFVVADFAAGLAVDRYICGYGGGHIDVLKGLRFFDIVNKEGLAIHVHAIEDAGIHFHFALDRPQSLSCESRG